MLARASLRKESGKGVILGLRCIHGWKGTIRLQVLRLTEVISQFSFSHLKPMLHAVELPASIAHLDTSLTNMHGKTFPHLDKVR